MNKIMMNFIKQKIPLSNKVTDYKTYTKILFSTYLFYFMFNSKKYFHK